eukprot:TRINITY_DN24704_c0_g1_i1.p1 TRINITY_DN24704_c0_g1~~TRINITY_DN24704_c0_g1_i1.p1  ORF type:complete len:158 (-),score=6.33 TRINITY_DN24704_c0_g1_i1:45-518(-)
MCIRDRCCVECKRKAFLLRSNFIKQHLTISTSGVGGSLLLLLLVSTNGIVDEVSTTPTNVRTGPLHGGYPLPNRPRHVVVLGRGCTVGLGGDGGDAGTTLVLSLIHISEPTRLLSISYAVFCLKKKKRSIHNTNVHSSFNHHHQYNISHTRRNKTTI